VSAAARQSGRLGRSTRRADAVELLTRVHGTGELPFSLAVVLVCTCRRWDRATAKLIAAIQDSGLRIAALEHLCELDGPETARRLAAADPNAHMRTWRLRPPTRLARSLFAT
jgi:hypothetical protein